MVKELELPVHQVRVGDRIVVDPLEVIMLRSGLGIIELKVTIPGDSGTWVHLPSYRTVRVLRPDQDEVLAKKLGEELVRWSHHGSRGPEEFALKLVAIIKEHCEGGEE